MCKLQIWRHEPAGQLWWQFRKPPWHPPCFWRSTRGRQRHWSSPPSPSPPLASLAPASSSLAPWLCLGRCEGPEKESVSCLSPFFLLYLCVSYLLVADKDDGDIGAEVFHLWCPLLWDVLQWVWKSKKVMLWNWILVFEVPGESMEKHMRMTSVSG